MTQPIESRRLALLADDDPGNAHRPGSLTLRYSGDIRTTLMSGAVFVLQSAHPIVSTVLSQHSRFREEPWKRLREIAASGQRFIYSGQEASLLEGQRLRELHRNIKGKGEQGQVYHSLNPEAYGWVHAIFLDTTFRTHELYGDGLSEDAQQGLFLEWVRLGEIFGLRQQDMPRTLAEYRDYFRHMVQEQLQYSPLITDLMTLTPPPPDAWRMPGALWPLLWKPAGVAKNWLTLAALPEDYRRKLAHEFPWTKQDEKNFQHWRRLVRYTVKSLPSRARQLPEAWKAMHAARNGKVGPEVAGMPAAHR